MPNVKTSDVVASSPNGWEDAVRQAVERANKTLVGLRGVEVTRLKAKVENGKIGEFRAHMKISFLLASDYPIHE
ncbi:MAG: dodecin domain-containing protein [Candidatus Hydrogenedentota bacterium]|nr:MAG: dodecin domain-containing protein [Candidatus Hydrogenedentota bacterium]